MKHDWIGLSFALLPLTAAWVMFLAMAIHAITGPTAKERREEILKACLTGGHPVAECRKLADDW